MQRGTYSMYGPLRSKPSANSRWSFVMISISRRIVIYHKQSPPSFNWLVVDLEVSVNTITKICQVRVLVFLPRGVHVGYEPPEALCSPSIVNWQADCKEVGQSENLKMPCHTLYDQSWRNGNSKPSSKDDHHAVMMLYYCFQRAIQYHRNRVPNNMAVTRYHWSNWVHCCKGFKVRLTRRFLEGSAPIEADARLESAPAAARLAVETARAPEAKAVPSKLAVMKENKATETAGVVSVGMIKEKVSMCWLGYIASIK